MLFYLVLSLSFLYILVKVESQNYKIVSLDEGNVKGEKYWNGDYYEFYGVPYAQAPSGKDRFQGPLPPQPWHNTLEAKNNSIVCPQIYYTGEDEESVVIGDEDCLVMNLFVPIIAEVNNLVPVLVYIHSGAFSIGNGNMAKFQYLVRHDVIVVSFNYRLGAIGFSCLGTKDIPGNAGLKDQVAALRWINKNIEKFGGDPRKVTVAGFSVGAAMAEMLALSKATNGLIDKIILESGSALSSWAINREPVATATNHAKSMGYNDSGSIADLTDFYMKTSADVLSLKSLNFFLKNGTFGFAPCIENVFDGIEPFLTESPVDILKAKMNKNIAILTGFANMEGLSRINHFVLWADKMNDNFSDFLPSDLKFSAYKEQSLIDKIKTYYFDGEEISFDNIQGYVDYTSDSLFKYAIMKSVDLWSNKLTRPIYLYEFAYVGNLNAKHNYMDLIKGASHRDQTSYILDFFTWTGKSDDLDTRDRLTMMWTDFVKYENPTAYENSLIDIKWREYTKAEPYYLHINNTLQIKRNLLQNNFQFWDKIYEDNYWNPLPPDTIN